MNQISKYVELSLSTIKSINISKYYESQMRKSTINQMSQKLKWSSSAINR